MWSKETSHSCLVVAEVAQAHDGSLGTAHAYIDAIANAGADAVKFQTHIAEAESTPDEPWRVRFSPQDETRFEYWKRMEFTEAQWIGLKEHAVQRGLKFLSSPFSTRALELLSRVGVDAWKIASGEFNNFQLLDQMTASGLPIFLSTGMSHLSEIDRAVEKVQEQGNELVVLQCTTSYPCPPEKIGLNLIPLFRTRYGCGVGLSDHSGTIYPGLAAAVLGIDVLEVHVAFSRECFGPDVPASVTTGELRQLVQGIRYIERMNSNPVQKDELASEAEPLRKIFTKSVAAGVNLPAGTVLKESHLTLRKPGTGIPANELESVIGRVLRRPVAANQLLHEGDLVEQLKEQVAS